MNNNVTINIINKSTNDLPAYTTAGAAGADVRAWLTDDIILKPFERALIPTGLFVEIPAGFEVQIRPRSGLALNYGITCLNTPGTIDSDYRGELKILLINLGTDNFVVKNSERIAQIIVAPVVQAIFEEQDALNESERGAGGFGHSGKH